MHGGKVALLAYLKWRKQEKWILISVQVDVMYVVLVFCICPLIICEPTYLT